MVLSTELITLGNLAPTKRFESIHPFAICSDEGLTFETSAIKSLYSDQIITRKHSTFSIVLFKTKT